MSKLVYLIAVWGGAQKYLLNSLQVQQLAVARLVCGFNSRMWSRKKILSKVGWLSVHQLVVDNAVLQAQKAISTGRPESLVSSISTEHPYMTRSATEGHIRYGESFRHDSALGASSFRHRSVRWYNLVPSSVRTGTLVTVKKKLRKWIWQNVPIG